MMAPAARIIGGKYLVLAKLGEGGMGEVFHAAHIHLEYEVAIKVLRPELVADALSFERFVREARAAARIASDNVVRILDVGGFEEGEPFIVMEYLAGEDLARRLERGALPSDEAIRYVLQACAAIAEVHRAGVIHRDLKPANLFLARQRHGPPIVKLVDFGISKATPRLGHAEPALTSKGMFMGTPLYMAPEQLLEGGGADSRTDVWALGVILFELMIGRVPFEEKNLLALCTRILTDRAPRLAQARPDLEFPPGLDDVLDRCLAKNRSERCSSASELAVMLTPFVRRSTAPLARTSAVPTLGAADMAIVRREEVASTLRSRRATRARGVSTEDSSPQGSPAIRSVGSSRRRMAIAALAAVLPVVTAVSIGVAYVSTSSRRAPQMAAVVAPPLDTVAVIDASAAVSRPTLQSEPAPPQPSPPTVHDTPIAAPMHAPTQARPRSSPMDEFGGRR